ncbi:MAG: TIGR04283 family arsenosugar biosynthesis glycosyltransferase [Balneolaceae bacterium]
MSKPDLSIIIPTINEAGRIGLLIDAIQRKGDCNITKEFIIADGGSTDETVSIAESSGACVIHCGVKGRGAQMNRGAKVSKADLLYFLHADTIPPENFDRQIVDSCEKGYESGCFRLRFDDPNLLLSIYGWFTRFKATWLRFGDQSMYTKKKLFHSISGFKEDLQVMEDQEIVSRLKKNSRFIVLDDYVITSARRYRKDGIIRLQLIFGLILTLYYTGAKQETLVNIYQKLIRS